MSAPLLAALPEDERAAFIDAGRLVVMQEDRDIVSQGEMPVGAMIVGSGRAEIIYLSENGLRLPVKVSEAGDDLGTAETIAGVPYAATCHVAANTALVVFTQAQMLELMTDMRCVQVLAAAACNAYMSHNQYCAADRALAVPQRIARYLLEIRDRSNMIYQNQSFLADATGSSRQTVNRVLGELRRREIIEVGKGTIHITSVPSLLAYADYKDADDNLA